MAMQTDIRRPQPLRNASGLQPERFEHVRKCLTRQDHQSVAARLVAPELHARRSREGRQLRGLLPRRRQALSRVGRRRSTRQVVGLPEQELRADARGTHAEHLLCGFSH